MTTTVTTSNGTNAALDDELIAGLRATVRGDVLAPGDSGYELSRTIFNVMHDSRPSLIVRCTGTADVVDAVKFARAHDLLVAVRGGGHSVAGHSLCDGGVVIDLSQMRGVDVDPDARVVRVQGGATWADVDRETQAFGLVVPGGVMSETGVGGLTLGGGYGWVRRKFGLSCDSLRSARVVCSDGSVRTASATSEADLFWALRGGGGNFGVVTNFEFDAHPLGPMVAFAGVFHPISQVGSVLRGWRDVTAFAPDEITSIVVNLTFPPNEGLPPPAQGEPCTVVAAIYAGPVEEGMKALAPFRELGDPLADISQPVPFAAHQTGFDWLTPPGVLRAYWKSQYLDGLSDGAIDAIAKRVLDRPDPLMVVSLFHMGGAIARVGAGETAFSERLWPYMVSIDGMWDDASDDVARIAWVRETWDDIARFGTGTTYTNFTGQSDEPSEALASTALGANMDRLRKIKTHYDPGNFFRLNANIPPG